MNRNLKVVVILLVACGLFARRSQPQQWEDSWREELLFASEESFPNRALQVEEDRYVYLERGKRDWKPVERGIIQKGLHGEFLFVSAAGSHKAAQFGGKELVGDWGRFVLEKHTVARFKPDPTWLTLGAKFSIGQIEVGMSHRRVRELYPEEATAAHDTTQFFYGSFFDRMVEVRYDENDLVARVAGNCLEQGGRPVFNKRTRRSDVERVFPESGWRAVGEREIRMEISGGRLSLSTGLGVNEVRPDFYCVLEERPDYHAR